MQRVHRGHPRLEGPFDHYRKRIDPATANSRARARDRPAGTPLQNLSADLVVPDRIPGLALIELEREARHLVDLLAVLHS